MLCLDRELHLGRLARHLGAVVKLDDPHARHFAYRRAGAGPIDPRDDLHAAAIARARRRAQATVPPAGPPTPEPPAGALRPAKPEIVTLAVAQARARLRRSMLIERAASTAAFAFLLSAWTVVYCVVCPPAHAATAIVTDEQLFSFFTWAPFALVVLFILACCWADHGTPCVGDEDEPGPAVLPPARPRFVDRAPATAPDLADLQDRRRAADRG